MDAGDPETDRRWSSYRVFDWMFWSVPVVYIFIKLIIVELPSFHSAGSHLVNWNLTDDLDSMRTF